MKIYEELEARATYLENLDEASWVRDNPYTPKFACAVYNFSEKKTRSFSACKVGIEAKGWVYCALTKRAYAYLNNWLCHNLDKLNLDDDTLDFFSVHPSMMSIEIYNDDYAPSKEAVVNILRMAAKDAPRSKASVRT